MTTTKSGNPGWREQGEPGRKGEAAASAIRQRRFWENRYMGNNLDREQENSRLSSIWERSIPNHLAKTVKVQLAVKGGSQGRSRPGFGARGGRRSAGWAAAMAV